MWSGSRPNDDCGKQNVGKDYVTSQETARLSDEQFFTLLIGVSG